MRDARPRRRTVNVSLALPVVFGALLATIPTARAVRVSGREVPRTCPPSAGYAVVCDAHGGANGRPDADCNDDGALCTRLGARILPIPTPSNDLIDDRGCS
ncbi:MAG TPA: hypothetical protein VGS80_18635 [Ktedonobacterales bacterium]|nr:hypothetical protein [Ktedonobacterales bacterium]